MKSGILKKMIDRCYPVLAVLLFLAVWLIAAVAMDVQLVLPTPGAAFRELFRLLGQGAFWAAAGWSVLRALASFVISFAVALLLAVAGRLLPPLAKLVSPLVVIFRATPTMSVILLALIWLNSKTAPILISVLIVFPVLYSALYGAICRVDRELVEMSRVYRVSRRDVVTRLYIPAMLPETFDAAQSSIGLSLKLIIAAEALAQTGISIGMSMQLSKMYLETAQLMAWTVAAIAFSWLLEGSVALARRVTVGRRRK